MMHILAPKHWQWQESSGCVVKKEHEDKCPTLEDDDTCSCTCMESSSHTTVNCSLDDSRSFKRAKRCSLKDPSENNHHQRRRASQSVSFGDVHVREFPVCLGDNPAVSSGVPVTIKWEHTWEGTFSVDYYEKTMAHKCNGKPETLSPLQRFCALRKAGISAPCISAAERDALACKSGRATTIERIHMDGFEGALQAIARSAWNATLNRRKKKEQRKMLEQYRESDKAHLTVFATSAEA